MTDEIISPPELGEPLPAVHPSPDTLKLLSLRRSSSAALLAEPGPSPEEMDRLLTIAARVPDHRRVVPFRFIVFEGAAREALAEIFAEAAGTSDKSDIPAPETAACLARRGASTVFVISSVKKEHKTPEWEQILTSGAVCQNLLLAASAMGYAGQWISEWVAYDDTVRRRLDIGAEEQVAGIIYLGTAAEEPKERARPDMAAITRRWTTS